MSISGINGNTHPWHWQSKATPGSASGQAAAGSATDSIANTGSVSAGNMTAFFQSFSADLQSMLSQGSPAAGSSPATHAATSQPPVGAHHDRHHHGGSGSSSGAADVMQALQAYGGSSTPRASTAVVA